MKQSIAFFYVDYADPTYRIMAEMMAASVHLVLPGYEVVLLTDNETPTIPGVDFVVRANVRFEKNKLMMTRLRMMDAFLVDKKNENIVFVDPDILFVNELNIFKDDFDVALTWRDNYPSMPFNTGVMATKTTKEALDFWHLASELCQTLPEHLHNWYGDQISVALMVGLSAFYDRKENTLQCGNAKVNFYSCNKYNYSPDVVEAHDADILHFKGARKNLMLQYFKNICIQRMGIDGGFFSLTEKNTKNLLLQRTDYTGVMKAVMDEKEALVSAKYTMDLYNEYRIIAPFLPKKAENTLDIGCGVGGINLFIFNHYAQSINIHLLDRDEVSEQIYFGYEKNAAAYNDLADSRALLMAAGVPEDVINTIDINTQKFPSHKAFDLVVSSLSWGFHYPLETYLAAVVGSLTKKGRLIVDVRKNTDGFLLLEKHFNSVNIIMDTPKYLKVCAKDKK